MRRSSTMIATLTLAASVFPLTRGAAQASPDARDTRETRTQRAERNVRDINDIALMLSWLDLGGRADPRFVSADEAIGARDLHLVGDVVSGDVPATASRAVFERAGRGTSAELRISTPWNADALRAAREQRAAEEAARLAADRRASEERAAARANAHQGPYAPGVGGSQLPSPPQTHENGNQTPVGTVGEGAVHNPTAGGGAVHDPSPTVTPEPATVVLLATGLLALLLVQRRQRPRGVAPRRS